MKVLIAIVFVFGSVSTLGSGPYLPSGWRPQGPSFYLPSEVVKADASIKENLFQETEASGSDALREYGPPKLDEVVQVASQGLPDVATEQTFFVGDKVNQDVISAAQEAVGIEAITEQVTATVKEVSTATEAPLAQISVEEPTTELLSEAQPFEASVDVRADIVEPSSEAEQTTGVAQEEVVTPTAVTDLIETVVSEAAEVAVPTAAIEEGVVLPTANIQEEIIIPTAVVEEVVVDRVAEGVNNIAEALANLEKEVKAAEALEAAVEIKQEISGSLEQAPEGFLEYGPPGFREYGPPKEEQVQPAAVEVASFNAFENNEVRRRRFSPKFKPSKKH